MPMLAPTAMRDPATATLRGDRRHHEARVAARRAVRYPWYAARYPGKTPGKRCANPWCCGNPRRMRGVALAVRLTAQERRAGQDAARCRVSPYGRLMLDVDLDEHETIECSSWECWSPCVRRTGRPTDPTGCARKYLTRPADLVDVAVLARKRVVHWAWAYIQECDTSERTTVFDSADYWYGVWEATDAYVHGKITEEACRAALAEHYLLGAL